MKYVAKDNENYLGWEDGNILPVEKNGKLQIEFVPDEPIPNILFDNPGYQLEVDYFHRNFKGWDIERTLDGDDNITKLVMTFTGKSNAKRQAKKVRHLSVRIQKPQSPGRYYAITAGEAHKTLMSDVTQEDPPEEIQCDECGEDLYPVPDNCPLCGASTDQVMPTVGELADKYGRDAKVGLSLSSMSADLVITWTRTKAQALVANKAARAIHDEKVRVYKAQTAAYEALAKPYQAKIKKTIEEKEKAELARLKAKFPDG